MRKHMQSLIFILDTFVRKRARLQISSPWRRGLTDVQIFLLAITAHPHPPHNRWPCTTSHSATSLQSKAQYWTVETGLWSRGYFRDIYCVSGAECPNKTLTSSICLKYVDGRTNIPPEFPRSGGKIIVCIRSAANRSGDCENKINTIVHPSSWFRWSTQRANCLRGPLWFPGAMELFLGNQKIANWVFFSWCPWQRLSADSRVSGA